MKYLLIMILILLAICGQTNSNASKNKIITAKRNENPLYFLPKDYVVFDKINGDLNKDGIEDCVLIIKATSKSKITTNQHNTQIDRNRRGIIVLLNKNGKYKLAVKNYDLFASENEDGGVYFAPELSVEIKKGNLNIHYGHGRYGYWKYTFRHQHADFELIGYDSSINRGPVILDVTSINFLTKKRLIKNNINKDSSDENPKEVFVDTSKSIKIQKLIKLSEIKDIDQLDMNVY